MPSHVLFVTHFSIFLCSYITFFLFNKGDGKWGILMCLFFPLSTCIFEFVILRVLRSFFYDELICMKTLMFVVLIWAIMLYYLLSMSVFSTFYICLTWLPFSAISYYAICHKSLADFWHAAILHLLHCWLLVSVCLSIYSSLELDINVLIFFCLGLENKLVGG